MIRLLAGETPTTEGRKENGSDFRLGEQWGQCLFAQLGWERSESAASLLRVSYEKWDRYQGRVLFIKGSHCSK